MNIVQALDGRKDSTTDNGDIAHSSTGSKVLDLFAYAGSSRNGSDAEISDLVIKAASENLIDTLKVIAWARDIRNGIGERRFFRTCINSLIRKTETFKDSDEIFRRFFYKYITVSPSFGRWDDICNSDFIENLSQEGRSIILYFVFKALNLEETDKEYKKLRVDLLKKWMPREKADPKFVKIFRKMFNLSVSAYRKLIATTKTTEYAMCENKWDTIDYPKLPSVASLRYKSAFFKHDPRRYREFCEKLKNGKVKVNRGVVYPHDVCRLLNSTISRDDIDAEWNALPEFFEATDMRILPIIDTSDSMNCGVSGATTAMDIAIGLGIYCAQRNASIFKNVFMTFTSEPHFVSFKHLDKFSEIYALVKDAPWGMNTNIDATYQLLLETAISNDVEQVDMPSVLLIVSDMQFDRCCLYQRATFVERTRAKYAAYGYEMPTIVFWQVNANSNTLPVRMEDKKTCIISGFTPVILKSVFESCGLCTPMSILRSTVLDVPRYSWINPELDHETIDNLVYGEEK